jgi:hypothetical protein
MTADFKVGKTIIEFFGLAGQFKKYDTVVMKKRAFWESKKICFIELFPQDLFPKSNLNVRLNSLINTQYKFV